MAELKIDSPSLAQRRAANRRRIAAGYGDPDPAPALTGAEVAHLAQLVGAPGCGGSRNVGRTQFAGGWRSGALAYKEPA